MNTLNIIITAVAIGATAYLMATLATKRVLSRQYGPQGYGGIPGPQGPAGPQGPQGEPGPAITCACPANEHVNWVGYGYNHPQVDPQ